MSSEAIQIEIGQYSIAGRKSRNDDSYGIVIPEIAILQSKGIAIAIADGMSSSEAAKEASECCVRSFLEDYYATHESWTVKRSVATVLKAVNGWLYAQGQRHDFDERGMVSTFSGMVLKSGLAHIFHAGDSRIYRLRLNRIEQLTTDHRIRVGRGLEHLSRAFGINQNLEIDYRQEVLEAGDAFLLTTDGVHDTLSGADMARLIVLHGGELDAAARAIVEEAFEKGSLDNLTCQIVNVRQPGMAGADSHKASASNLPFPKLLAAGEHLDGFTIIRPLHESSRSQVYLAKDSATGEIVAIKTPSPNFEDDAGYIGSFAREEWIGRLVSSPHVLKIHASNARRRSLYHVTEYFDGRTLQQWMLDNPSPDIEAVRSIIAQIALGLRALHRKDVLHLDMKPGNVMIDANGLVKIIDFGSSQAASWADESGRAAHLVPAGTADYAAPEHLTGAPPSNRSDIYSLGVIGYEMLTGFLPYGKGITSAAQVKKLAYVPAASRRKDIPDWVDAALEQAVRKSPSERTEALSALVEDLRKPNSELGFGREKPLIERNPVAFWKGVSALLLVACFGLAMFAALS
jgi:eukaryotic-like serine/threonine-protein kinase